VSWVVPCVVTYWLPGMLFLFSAEQGKKQQSWSKRAQHGVRRRQKSQRSRILFLPWWVLPLKSQVYFSAEGIFSRLNKASTIVDMSTTAPSLSLEIADAANQQGAHAVDAPVSGGDIGARDASLSIMAGGKESVVNEVRPLLDCMGKSITYMGPSGSGQHTKLCNQLVVAGTMIGVCEALLYASKAGLDCNQLIVAIRPGAAACWTLDNLAPRIIKGDDAPGFMVDHFLKDLGIAVQESQALQLDLPGLKLAHELYLETQKIGHGQSGTQALIHALKKLSKS